MSARQRLQCGTLLVTVFLVACSGRTDSSDTARGNVVPNVVPPDGPALDALDATAEAIPPPGFCSCDVSLGSAIGAAIATGTTEGYPDEQPANFCTGIGSPDVTLCWTAPTSGTYRFTYRAEFSASFTHYLGTCSETLDGCVGVFPGMEVTLGGVPATAGEVFTFVIDGGNDDAGPASGSWTFSVGQM